MVADRTSDPRFDTLSPRELEVLRLLAKGHDAKSISASLAISVGSVNERLREVRRKLGTSSSREAARLLGAHEQQEAGSKNVGPKEIGVAPPSSQHAPSVRVSGAAALARSPALILGGVMFLSLALAGALALADRTTQSEPSPALQTGAGSHARHIAVFSDVPITYDGSYVRVPARLGPIESDLILDTAASSTVISPKTRDALELTRSAQVDVLGAGGTAQYEAVELPALNIGGLESRNVGAVVLELARFGRSGQRPYGGILSNAFLRAYDVELNVRASRLRLYQPSPSPLIHGFPEAQAVPNLAADPGWVVVEVVLNGHPVRAIIDTAAPSSVMNWAAARRAGVAPDAPGLRRRERPTGGLGAKAAETHMFKFDEIRAGRTSWDGRELRIADLQVFEALGLKQQPAMLLGLDLLRETPVLISYSTGKVYFQSNAD